MNKILSFDVGIKNLAYCFIQFNEANNFDNILEWGIINLKSDLWMPDQNNKKCGFKKKDVECGKGTNHWIIKDGVRIDLCKMHANSFIKQYNAEMKNGGYDSNNQVVEKVGFEYYPYELRDLRCHCGEKARKFKMVGAGLQEIRLVGYCNKCSKKAEGNLIKISDYMKEDDTKLYTKLYEGLSHLGLDGINRVIIENQPALKNPRMKSVQMFIYSYFFCGAKESKFPNLENVGFFNASKKLDPTKIVEDLLKQNGEEISLEQVGGEMSEYKAYKKRKTDGVELVRKILKGGGEWLQYFESHPKKDDLADSLLQGIAQYSRK